MTAQLSAPAIGYRAFKWDGSGPLKATGVEASWPISRAPQYAKCIQTTTPHHVAPQESCTCGIHAYSTPGQVGAGVGGVVMGYGNLIIHPDGWRAEIVELVALVLPLGADARWKSAVSPEAIQMIAEQYGVRALDRWEDAAAVAREYGAEPIPEILHAEAEAWQLGPEKYEPLFPDGMSAHFGDLERRIRDLLPWVERNMIRRVDTHLSASPTYYTPMSSGSIALPLPLTTEVQICAMHPSGAEVKITLHT